MLRALITMGFITTILARAIIYQEEKKYEKNYSKQKSQQGASSLIVITDNLSVNLISYVYQKYFHIFTHSKNWTFLSVNSTSYQYSHLLRFFEKHTTCKLEITYAGGWSLCMPLSFDFPYPDLFLQFWPRMTLNMLDKNFFILFDIIKRFENQIESNNEKM